MLHKKIMAFYSIKINKYTQNIQPYTIEFNLENNNIVSKYGKQ